MSTPRSGMLLLEVMLGTAILGIAAVALVTLLDQTLETVRAGRGAERRMMLATEVLNRASLWNTSQLDGRIGTFRNGVFDVEVGIAAPRLYSIAVRDTLSGAALIETLVYRHVAPVDAD